jgi:hypothetical protein
MLGLEHSKQRLELALPADKGQLALERRAWRGGRASWCRFGRLRLPSQNRELQLLQGPAGIEPERFGQAAPERRDDL